MKTINPIQSTGPLENMLTNDNINSVFDYESNSTATFSLVPEQIRATNNRSVKSGFFVKLSSMRLSWIRYEQSGTMDEWDNCNYTIRWLQPVPKTKKQKY